MGEGKLRAAIVILLVVLAAVAAAGSATARQVSSASSSCDTDPSQFSFTWWNASMLHGVSAASTCTETWASTALTSPDGAVLVAFYLPPGVEATVSWQTLKASGLQGITPDGSLTAGGPEPCVPSYGSHVPAYVIGADGSLTAISCA